jgi:hypothetical protein
MPVWEMLADSFGVLLVLVLLYGIGLIVRRRFIARHGGTFELSYRARTTRPGRGWLLGIGRYSGEDLEWFRIFSLAPRPKKVWDRFDLEYAARRDPIGGEQLSLFSDSVIVSCTTQEGIVEFAMSPSSLMGFQAWLEAMPPGSRGVRPGDSPGA